MILLEKVKFYERAFFIIRMLLFKKIIKGEILELAIKFPYIFIVTLGI